jgi:hypothetical protein
MLRKRAMVLMASALLIGSAGCSAAVSPAKATRTTTDSNTEFNMPGVVPTTSSASDPQLECSVNGGEWSTYTNECVLEQPD